MFEPMLKCMDAAHGMVVGALSGCADTATSMAHQGAKEGHSYGGPAYGAIGGAWGWAYGGILGLWTGALQGSCRGAKDYFEKDEPLKPTPTPSTSKKTHHAPGPLDATGGGV